MQLEFLDGNLHQYYGCRPHPLIADGMRVWHPVVGLWRNGSGSARHHGIGCIALYSTLELHLFAFS